MNGITPPLLLLLLLAQISTAQSPDPLAIPNNEFGWEIDKNDGALVFIVQVLPEEAKAIQNVQARIDAGVRSNRPALDPETRLPLEPLEITSSMPPDLIGRASRVSIRIGEAVLPRTPSIEKIRRMPRYGIQSDVSQAMGTGKLSEFESDSVVPVQGNGGLPQLPFGGNARSAGQNGNIADQARQLSDSARSSLGGISPPDLGSAPGDFLSGSRAESNRPLPGSNDRRFSDTAPPLDLPTTGGTTDRRATDWNATDSQAGNGLASQYPDLQNDYASRSAATNPNSNQFGLNSNYDSGRRPPTDGFGAPPNPNANPSAQRNYDFSAAADRRIADNRGRPSTSAQGNFASNANAANPTYDPRSQRPAANPYTTPANPNAVNPGLANGVNPNSPNGFQPGGAANPNYPTNQQVQQPPVYQQPGYGQQLVQANTGYGIPGQAGLQGQLPLYAGPLRADAQPPAANNQYEAFLAGFEKGKGLASVEVESPSAGDKSNAALPPGSKSGGPQANGTDREIAETSPFAKTRDVFVKMFFLVSLLANCYLAYLIRKLLMRYRSLLSTVRAHAVT